MRVAAFPVIGSLVLLISMLLLVLVPTVAVFVIVSGVATFIGAIPIIDLIRNPRSVKIFWLMSGALLVGYAGGALASFLLSGSSDDFFWSVSGGRPIAVVANALSLVIAPCAVLLVLGIFERPLFGREQLGVSLPLMRRWSWIFLAVVFFAYWQGDLDFMGTVAGANKRISALGALAYVMIPALFGYLGVLSAKSRWRRQKLVLLFQVVMALLLALPTGRRLFLADLLAFGTGFALAGGLDNWGMTRKLVSVSLLGFVAYLSFFLFFVMRVAGYQIPHSDGPNLLGRVDRAMTIVTTSEERSRVIDMMAGTTQSRTFILGYYADLLSSLSGSKPLHGKILVNSILVAVPSVLYPDKDRILREGSSEDLANPVFHLTIDDKANSLLTDGISDFGIIGVFVYTWGVVAVLLFFVRMSGRWSRPEEQLLVLFVVVSLLLVPETSLSGYVSGLRNVFLIWAAMLAAGPIVGFYSSVLAPRVKSV